MNTSSLLRTGWLFPIPNIVNKPDNYMCPADAKLPVDTKPSFSTTATPSALDVEGELISPMQDLNSPSSTADNPTNAVLYLYLAGCLHLPQTIVSCRGLDMNVFLLLSYFALTLQCMSWVPFCRLQGLTHMLSSNFHAVISFMLVDVMPDIGFQVLAIHAYWVGFPVSAPFYLRVSSWFNSWGSFSLLCFGMAWNVCLRLLPFLLGSSLLAVLDVQNSNHHLSMRIHVTGSC